MNRILFLLVLLFPLAAPAQTPVKPLDINLENYTYPYAVSYLNLDEQQQHLKWAIWI